MKKSRRLQKVIFSLALVSVFVLLKLVQVDVVKFVDIKSFRRSFNKNAIQDFSRNFATHGNLPESIFIENEFWQLLKTSNGTFKMFNAYYDNREYFKRSPLVRILAFINRVDPVVQTHCQLWFEGISTPYTVKTIEYKVIWNKGWGINSIGYQPHLIACVNPLAERGFIPSSVSLVENETDDATNNLKVINNLPENNSKKPFAVCVKDLDFMDDQSMQIIEWIEILSLLGADKIFVYVIKIHPNMMKTLKYFESQGKVVIEMITEPDGLPKREQSLQQWYQNMLISLNDCLYKHMNEYDYLSPLDIDEIIVPSRQEDKTWMDLLRRVEGTVGTFEPRCAYVARNVFFLTDNNHALDVQPDVPHYMTFLQHIYRAANFSHLGVGSKSFQSTELVLSMHNHYPMECIGKENINYHNIDIEDGKLQHYRKDCENYPKDECKDFKDNTVKDLTLWNLKDEIIANVDKTLEALNNLYTEVF